MSATSRLLQKAMPLALLLSLTLAGGCATTLVRGDRLFLAGDLTRAEAAYRKALTGGHSNGNAAARARYRLGLIYALPESELHDWAKAEQTLQSLIERQPESAWARQASLLLSLHRERERLEQELEAQRRRANALLAEVAQLEDEARQAGDQVEERDSRLKRLAREIGQLRRDIGELGDKLAASEQELEEIKKIDLQTPP